MSFILDIVFIFYLSSLVFNYVSYHSYCFKYRYILRLFVFRFKISFRVRIYVKCRFIYLNYVLQLIVFLINHFVFNYVSYLIVFV